MQRMTRGLLCFAFILSISASASRVRGGDIVDTAVAAGSFKTLAAALQAADLVDSLKSKGPFTVFAPTDEAFSQLPEGTVASLLKPENKEQLVSILTYHVAQGAVPAADVVEQNGVKSLNGQQIDIKIDGDKVFVDDAQVIKTDIATSNGIIHVIDRVILPASNDIATTAVEAGQFKTLVAAAQAAGLVDALTGDGPLTVFAPTDDAFAKLPAGTVETLLQPENKAKLAEILKYHVAAGRVYASDALAAGKARTLQGQSVTIGLDGDTAKVNNAVLLATDLDASNGVIHVIDSVILPPEKQTSATPRRMIESAIAEGAPLYNSGHPDACARVYMKTAREVLAMNDHGMSSSTARHLMTALKTSEHSHCQETRAWTMRRALDMAYRDVR